MFIGDGFIFVDNKSVEQIQELVSLLSRNGGGLCIISSDVPKGILIEKCPDNVRLLDLRYGGFLLLHTKHPRQEGIWPQYSHLQTGLAKNIVISDTITAETKIENWEGKEHSLQLAPFGTTMSSEEYRHQHNHYQNLLCETFNFTSDLNAVSIWGDSGAFVPGAKSWGGFFSARSWPLKWTGYTPEYAFAYEDSDFDAALVGVEIDVLNAGKNWGDPSPLLSSSMAKVGLQVVGFGKRNTAAIEIRTEDSDDPTKTPETRRGAWQWGIIVRNALHEGSTLIHCENGKIKRGVDLSMSTFTEGALLITGAGEKSGIVFDHGKSGEVYANDDCVLVIRSGEKGLILQFDSGDFISFSAKGEISMSDNIRSSINKMFEEMFEEMFKKMYKKMMDAQ
jgi:hypothetical protein